MQLNTTWVKTLDAGAGSGGDWALRIAAAPTEVAAGDDDASHSNAAVSVFFYVHLEKEPECGYKAREKWTSSATTSSSSSSSSSDSWIHRVVHRLLGFGSDNRHRRSSISEQSMRIDHLASDASVVRGSSPHLGHWALFATDGSGGALSNTRFVGLKAPSAHNITDELRPNLVVSRRGRGAPAAMPRLLNTEDEDSTLAVFQVNAALPFTIDLSFIGGDDGDAELYPPSADGSYALDSEVERLRKLSGHELSKTIASRENAFDTRFDATFPSPTSAHTSSSSSESEDAHRTATEMAKAALSNTLGSTGYFYGCSIIKEEDRASRMSLYGPSALLSGVPSRSFFPRGFLWDEGFHQLLVSRWDAELSRYVVAHWLDLMSSSGWIPREQILGTEARARVPDQFVAQDRSAANPPSMLLAVERLLDEHGDDDATVDFLRLSWPRLQSFYGWYNTTQVGRDEGSYRWRGRDPGVTEVNPKTLTSGLDDYPRASHPSASERHLDLRCWMAIASRIMGKIGRAVGADTSLIHTYRHTQDVLSDFDLLNKQHYHKSSKRYYDYGLHTEDVTLQRVLDQRTGQPTVVRSVTSGPKLKKVPHFGYVSLFPLIALLLPASSDQLIETVRQLRDPELMWTDFGLRSLSKDSSLYDRGNTFDDAPYWRGPIWINLNYLTLSALHKYAGLDPKYVSTGGNAASETATGDRPDLTGPYTDEVRQVYLDLRRALLENIERQYRETGYLWEHYDDKDGHGKGTHPFTGWTALAALIHHHSYPS